MDKERIFNKEAELNMSGASLPGEWTELDDLINDFRRAVLKEVPFTEQEAWQEIRNHFTKEYKKGKQDEIDYNKKVIYPQFKEITLSELERLQKEIEAKRTQMEIFGEKDEKNDGIVMGLDMAKDIAQGRIAELKKNE